MKKRLLSFMLTICMALSSATSVFARPFEVDPNEDPLYFNPFYATEEAEKSEKFRKEYFDKFDNEVIIAVIDTGFGNSSVVERYTEGRVLPGYNVDDGSSNVKDTEGHGTTVCETALHNSTKNVKILPIKGGNKVGIPLVKAVRYAIDHGADIINMSFVEQTATDDIMTDDVKNILKEAKEKNIMVVCGAGNITGTSIGYPANNKSTIAVGESKYLNDAFKFAGGSTGKEMDFCATTDGLYPCYVYTKDQEGNIIEDAHEEALGGSGTSYAAPMVAGCFAMLKSLHPNYTWDQLYDLALRLSDDVNQGENATTGWDECTGWGQISLDKLLCDHTFETEGTYEATCEYGAFTKSVCTKCGYWERLNEGTPLGHSLVNDEDGCMICERCGEEFDHEWKMLEGDSTYCKECTVCGEKKSHGYKQVTCVASHYLPKRYRQECKTCGYVKGKIYSYGSAIDHDEMISVQQFYENYQNDPESYPVYTYDMFNDDGEVCTVSVDPKTVIDNISQYQDKAVSCTEDGHTFTICPTCYYVEDTVTKADGHSYEVTDTKKATCTEAGYTEYTCSVCNDSYRENSDPAAGHSWDDGTASQAATCTADGVMTYTCTECKSTRTEKIDATGHQHTKTINQTSEYTGDTYCEDCDQIIACGSTLDHVWNDGEITTTPGCTTTGVRTYHCTNEGCNETYTEVVEATGHQHTEIRNKKESTCTETGYSGDTYCKDCGSLISEGQTVPTKEHTYTVEVSRVDATCKDEGQVTYKCANCDSTKTDTISKTNKHTPGDPLNASDATCTEDGYTGDVYCSVCEKLLNKGEAITAIDHDYEVTEITPATCTEKGEKTSVCNNCGDKKKEDIPAKGHVNLETRNIREATCTETGYTGDTVCADCGKVVKSGSVVSAKGHTKVVKNKKSATCTAAGYTGDTYCSTCGEKLSSGSSVKALGHSFGGWVTTKAATAVATGTQTRTCSRCHAKETRTIAKLTATGNLNSTAFPVKVKQSAYIAVTGLASGDYVVSWATSDKNRVTVDRKGKVTGKKKGSATITCTLASGKKLTAKVSVQTGTVKTSSIVVNSKNVTMKKGATFQLLAARAPFTSQQGVTYSTKSSKIATVSKTGKITAKKPGRTYIYVKSGNKKVSVKVTVQGVPTTRLNANRTEPLTLKKGKSFTWKVTKVPTNSTDAITYTTSNKKVATVSGSGKIVGKKKGTATITAKAGSKKITLKVTIQ